MKREEKLAGFREKFFSLVEPAQSILITGHIDPDDDSIGSVMALSELLSQKYPEKRIEILYPCDVGARWNIFPAFSRITPVQDLAARLGEFDVAIFLDGSKLSRFTLTSEQVGASGVRTVCIDHHPAEPDHFDMRTIVPGATSVCELVYRIFCEGMAVPESLARSLLLGMLGDTDGLKYVGPQNTHVFAIVAHLVKQVHTSISEFMIPYRVYSEGTFQMIQRLTKSARVERIGDWPSVLISFVSRNDIAELGLTGTEIHAAAHEFNDLFGKSIQGVSWGVTFYPKESGEVKVSARSRIGSVNVRTVFECMQIGGGHACASGGRFAPLQAGEQRESEECAVWFVNWLKAHEPLLQ